MATAALPDATNHTTPSHIDGSSHIDGLSFVRSHTPLVIFSSALGVGVVASTWGPRRDVDYWWRALLGEEMWQGHGLSASGDWTTFGGDATWTSTQVLGDLSIALIDSALPTAGPLVLRASVAGAAFVVLAWLLQPWSPHATAVRIAATVCGAFTVAGFVQERPASMVLPLFPLAGVVAGRLLLDVRRCAATDGVLTVGLFVGALWILIHPSWLLPATVTAAALLGKPGIAPARRLVVLATTAIGVSVLLSAGMWHRVDAISDAGTHLAEWQHTDITDPAALPLLAVAGVWLGHWYTTRKAPDRGMVIALALLTLAGLAYWRNMAPVVLFALGLLAADLSLDAAQRGVMSPMCPRATGPIVGAVAFATFGLSVLAHLQPVRSPSDDVATLAQVAVCSARNEVTIAAHYDDHGAALYGARRSQCRGAQSSRVPMDGRADRYGPELIGSWQRAVAGDADWPAVFLTAAPTHAVLPIGNRLARELQGQHWAPLLCRGGYILLAQHAPSNNYSPN